MILQFLPPLPELDASKDGPIIDVVFPPIAEQRAAGGHFVIAEGYENSKRGLTGSVRASGVFVLRIGLLVGARWSDIVLIGHHLRTHRRPPICGAPIPGCCGLLPKPRALRRSKKQPPTIAINDVTPIIATIF